MCLCHWRQPSIKTSCSHACRKITDHQQCAQTCSITKVLLQVSSVLLHIYKYWNKNLRDRRSQKWHNLAQELIIKKYFGEQRQVFALSFKKVHDMRWEGEGELASLVRCVTELHVTKNKTAPERNHKSLYSRKKKTIVSENIFTEQFTESISHVSVASVQQISEDVCCYLVEKKRRLRCSEIQNTIVTDRAAHFHGR